MTKYKIEVTEVLKRTIEMEADNKAAAIEMVKKMYHNCYKCYYAITWFDYDEKKYVLCSDKPR